MRKPTLFDERPFLEAIRRSRRLHAQWVSPPRTPTAFREYLASRRAPTHYAFLVCRKETGSLAGVIHLSEIGRGNFQSGYLGYYAFEPHAVRA